MSGFKVETYLKKGYSLEEAQYQVKIRRPTNVEYYMYKFGMNKEEAIIAVSDYSTKAAKKAASRPKQKIRESSHRCKEYWIKRGYTEEEAILEISERQITFSLEICIEKYGEVEGRKRWEERQKKWLGTLDSKTDEEKAEINRKKTNTLEVYIDRFGKEEGESRYRKNCNSRKIKIFESLEEVKQDILMNFNGFDSYKPLKKFKKQILNKRYFDFIEKPKNFDIWLLSFLNFKDPYNEIIFKNNIGGNKYGYMMHVDDKLLRSSNEIYFYQLLYESGLNNNLDFIIEKYYNNSKMRCDFFLVKGQIYIEIAGSDNEEYIQKMKYKESTFGSKILWSQKEYKEFVDQYIKEYYASNN